MGLFFGFLRYRKYIKVNTEKNLELNIKYCDLLKNINISQTYA